MLSYLALVKSILSECPSVCLVGVRTALPKVIATGIVTANGLEPFFNPYSFIFSFFSFFLKYQLNCMCILSIMPHVPSRAQEGYYKMVEWWPGGRPGRFG